MIAFGLHSEIVHATYEEATDPIRYIDRNHGLSLWRVVSGLSTVACVLRGA